GMNLCPVWRRPSNTFGVAAERSINISVAASRGSLSGNDMSRSDFVMRSAQSFPRSFVIVLSVACRARDILAVAVHAGAEAGGWGGNAGPPPRPGNEARRQPGRLPRA